MTESRAAAIEADMQQTALYFQGECYAVFLYRNHAGVTSIRRALVRGLRYGVNAFYPTLGFLFRGYCLDRKEVQEFNMLHMSHVVWFDTEQAAKNYNYG